jgi:hypothetical protein
MKRLTIFLLVLLLLPVQALAAFSDVPETHWASASVEQMAEAGILEGYPDGTFRPDETLSRAQFLAMVVRACWPELAAEPQDGEAWWAPWYEVAVQKELLLDDCGAVFAANTEADMNAPITRYEMATVLSRAYRTVGGTPVSREVTFTDADQFPEAYRSKVYTATMTGLLNGYPDGSFSGQAELKRSEGAAAVQRLCVHMRFDESDRIIAANGNAIITYEKTNSGVVITSCSALDGTVIQTLEVPIDTENMQEHEIMFTLQNDICWVNDHAFWGTAGYFTYDAAGMVTQVTDQPIIDAEEASDGSVVAITCDAGTFHGYSVVGEYELVGDQVIRISPAGEVTTLLSNEPAHGLSLLSVTSAEETDVRVTHNFVMGMADLHRYEYAVENGRLRALEHEPGAGFSGYTPEEAAQEQLRLDEAGCGVGSTAKTE